MKRSLFLALGLTAALGISTGRKPLDLLTPLASTGYCCQNARIACRNDCAPCHFVFVCQINDCASDCECTC